MENAILKEIFSNYPVYAGLLFVVAVLATLLFRITKKRDRDKIESFKESIEVQLKSLKERTDEKRIILDGLLKTVSSMFELFTTHKNDMNDIKVLQSRAESMQKEIDKMSEEIDKLKINLYQELGAKRRND